MMICNGSGSQEIMFLVFFTKQYYFDSGLDYFDRLWEKIGFNLH